MPKFLIAKLTRRYPADPAAPYKILNKLGFMRGPKETAAGRAADRTHQRDVAAGRTH